MRAEKTRRRIAESHLCIVLAEQGAMLEQQRFGAHDCERDACARCSRCKGEGRASAPRDDERAVVTHLGEDPRGHAVPPAPRGIQRLEFRVEQHFGRKAREAHERGTVYREFGRHGRMLEDRVLAVNDVGSLRRRRPIVDDAAAHEIVDAFGRQAKVPRENRTRVFSEHRRWRRKGWTLSFETDGRGNGAELSRDRVRVRCDGAASGELRVLERLRHEARRSPDREEREGRAVGEPHGRGNCDERSVERRRLAPLFSHHACEGHERAHARRLGAHAVRRVDEQR